MKKKLSILLCLSLMLALAACDTQPTPTTDPATDPTTIPTSIPTEPSVPATTEPTEAVTPGVTEPVVYDLPMSAVVLTDHKEVTTDSSGNAVFTYTYQNVRLYLSDESVSEAVTLDLLNRIDATRTAAEKVLEDVGSASPDSPYWFTVRYVPERIDGGILSLSGTQTSYSGGSHANSACIGVTYDLVNGRVLGLGDILKDDCTADVIARLVIDALGAIAEDNFLYEDYSVTVEERFSGDFRGDESWYLSNEGLCFAFGPYEVAPYSSGIVTAVIPYERLSGVLEDACFPVEQITADGGLFSCAYEDADTSQYSRFAEVVLDPAGSASLFYTDGLLYNITIETGSLDAENADFIPDATIFAASSLVSSDAVIIQAQPDTYVRMTCISAGKPLTLILKLLSQ